MSQIPAELEAQLAAAEAALHTATDVARALFIGYPHLPVTGLKIKKYSDGYEVHLDLPDAGTVQAWADALSLGSPTVVPVTCELDDLGYGGSPVFEHVVADAAVHGHRVRLWSCRILSGDEAAAWRKAHNDAITSVKRGEPS